MSEKKYGRDWILVDITEPIPLYMAMSLNGEKIETFTRIAGFPYRLHVMPDRSHKWIEITEDDVIKGIDE